MRSSHTAKTTARSAVKNLVSKQTATKSQHSVTMYNWSVNSEKPNGVGSLKTEM